MDVFSKGMERRAERAPFFLKPFLNLERKRLARYEKEIFPFFQKRTIISEQDRQLLPFDEKNEVVVIPNGVDSDFFRPMKVKKEYSIVLTGNMGYAPNIDGAVFLAKKVL